MLIAQPDVIVEHIEAHIPQTETDLEERIKELKLEAPRILPAELKALIKEVEYVEHLSVGGKLVRWCVLTLHSGFVVAGDPNITYSPENDRPSFGRELAYENAFDKIWQLEAYHRQQSGYYSTKVQATISLSETQPTDNESWTPGTAHDAS